MLFSSNINPDDVYKDIINSTVQDGNVKGDRTGTGTISVVGRSARYSLLNGRNPRLTTKLLTDTPEREMLWFRNGKSSIKELRDQNIGIWNGWMIEGTAQYRAKTPEEITKQAIKCFANTGNVHLYAHEEFVKLQSQKGVNTYGKFLVKLTYNGSDNKVDIHASTKDFSSVEDMVTALAMELNIDPKYLVDGDIGPGGYGPQWRHWKDTQVILDSQRKQYMDKGYKVIGRTDSSVDADYHHWDLMDKIKEQIYNLHPELSVVYFHMGYDDVDEARYNTFKLNCVQSGDVMDIYYSGDRALQELYKSLYKIPTLIVHREIDQLSNAIALLRDEPNSRRIIVSAWNPGLTWQAALPPCFEAGTLVATPTGYRAIESIEEGEEVLSATGIPRQVNKKWVTPYNGSMISLKVGYIGPRVNCTPNHPFLVKGKGFVEAKDITTADFIGIPKTKSIKNHEFGIAINCGAGRLRKEQVTLSIDDYYTLGYFMGNGWASQTGNRVSFAIPHSKVDDILPRLRRTIKISRKPCNAPNVSTYETKSDKWVGLFREFGHKAHGKRIPQWVMESLPEAKESFLEGFFDADGHFPYFGKVNVTTVSPSVAYGIQRLLADFGMTPSVSLQKKKPTHVIEGRVVNQRDLWHVAARIPINRPQVSHDDDYLWVPVKNIEEYAADTVVYNFDVEEEHTYMVHNLATHNCHCFFQFISHELTLEQRFEILRDRVNLEYNDIEVAREKQDYHSSHPIWVSGEEFDLKEARDKGLSDEQIHVQLDSFDIKRRGLYCFLLLRSNDLGLGQPFNVAQYASLTHMIAQCVGMEPLELIWNAVDAHVYANHVAPLQEQLEREPKHCIPRIKLNPERKEIDDFTIGDITIVDYESHPSMAAKMPPAI